MCGQHNVRATAGYNTGQNTKDTPNPRTEIKIPDPAGNGTRAAKLEGRTLPTTPRRLNITFNLKNDSTLNVN